MYYGQSQISELSYHACDVPNLDSGSFSLSSFGISIESLTSPCTSKCSNMPFFRPHTICLPFGDQDIAVTSSRGIVAVVDPVLMSMNKDWLFFKRTAAMCGRASGLGLNSRMSAASWKDVFGWAFSRYKNTIKSVSNKYVLCYHIIPPAKYLWHRKEEHVLLQSRRWSAVRQHLIEDGAQLLCRLGLSLYHPKSSFHPFLRTWASSISPLLIQTWSLTARISIRSRVAAESITLPYL